MNDTDNKKNEGIVPSVSPEVSEFFENFFLACVAFGLYLAIKSSEEIEKSLCDNSNSESHSDAYFFGGVYATYYYSFTGSLV